MSLCASYTKQRETQYTFHLMNSLKDSSLKSYNTESFEIFISSNVRQHIPMHIM